MMCFKLKMRIEFHNKFFYNLIIFLLISSFLLYIFKTTIFINVLNFLNMLMFKHKLLIQILKINDIKINHVNFTEAGENGIFK